MSDNKSEVRPQDAARVNVNEDYEVRYWSNKFNCSESRLRDAVKAVGVSAKAVEEYLSKK